MNFIEKNIAEKESPNTYLEILKVHNKEVHMANLGIFHEYNSDINTIKKNIRNSIK